MPDSDEVAARIRERLLCMGGDQLIAEAERALLVLDKRNSQLSDVLEELLHEVDELLLRMDKLEIDELDFDDEEDACIR
jgi:hypothetical protein